MKPLIAVSCHELDAPELARGMEALQGDRGATFMLLWELYAGIFDGVARAGACPSASPAPTEPRTRSLRRTGSTGSSSAAGRTWTRH